MSDINELIHTTCMHAYNQGIDTERERIIKLLETDKVERQPVCSDADCEKCPAFERGFDRAIALIKGENK